MHSDTQQKWQYENWEAFKFVERFMAFFHGGESARLTHPHKSYILSEYCNSISGLTKWFTRVVGGFICFLWIHKPLTIKTCDFFMGILALIPFSCAKTKTKTNTKTNALVRSGDNALTNKRELSSSGSFSFSSWHTNSLLVLHKVTCQGKY